VRSELDKLLLYTEGRRDITVEDVEAACTFSVKTRVFDLLDSAANGNAAKAIAQLGELFSLREPPLRILSMLAGHVALLWKVKKLGGMGLSLGEITQKLKLHPYRARILSRQCTRYTEEQLARAVLQCGLRDEQIKTGRMAPELALELLIADVKGGP